MASRLRRGGRGGAAATVEGAEDAGSPRATCGARGSRGCAAPALGFPFGAMPTGGAEIPTFLSYATERRLARGKAKEEFGKGAIEGVAGPEAANNAAFTGVLVPLLTLGHPDLGDRRDHARRVPDLRPPARAAAVRATSRDLVWALIASLYVGNVMLLALNLPLIRLWVKVLEIPRAAAVPRRSSCSRTLGVYSISGLGRRGARHVRDRRARASSCAATTSRSRR